MKREDHWLITEKVFGRPYKNIHKWLDEMFPKYWGFLHWQERHHLEAILEKYQADSVECAVAMFHVLCDYLSHLHKWKIPANRQEILDEFSY